MKIIFLCFFSILIYSVNIYAMGARNRTDISSSSNAIAFPQGGGSNMVFLDLGNYVNNVDAWATDVKATLLHYQEYRKIAQQRMRIMRENGQTKIAVVLWYIEDGHNCSFYAHYVCPQKGKVSEDIQKNIKLFIQDANDAQFDTLIFRFAAQGAANPMHDENYQLHRIDESWNLLVETFKITEAALEGKKIKILYDLGLEMMGHKYSGRKGSIEFFYTIWGRYSNQYSLDKTIGFSFNHAHGSYAVQSLDVYKNYGKWPALVGIDIYQDTDKYLGSLANALKKVGKPDHPVAIIETYYNNAKLAQGFRKAKSKLNLQFILQWPLAQDIGRHSNNPETPLINNYINTVEFPLLTPIVFEGETPPVIVPPPQPPAITGETPPVIVPPPQPPAITGVRSTGGNSLPQVIATPQTRRFTGGVMTANVQSESEVVAPDDSEDEPVVNTVINTIVNTIVEPLVNVIINPIVNTVVVQPHIEPESEVVTEPAININRQNRDRIDRNDSRRRF